MGPRTSLEGCGISRPPLGFNPRTVQLVASRYTDCTIPAHTRRAEHVESMCEKSGAYRISVVDLTERDHLEDRDLDGSII